MQKKDTCVLSTEKSENKIAFTTGQVRIYKVDTFFGFYCTLFKRISNSVYTSIAQHSKCVLNKMCDTSSDDDYRGYSGN